MVCCKPWPFCFCFLAEQEKGKTNFVLRRFLKRGVAAIELPEFLHFPLHLWRKIKIIAGDIFRRHAVGVEYGTVKGEIGDAFFNILVMQGWVIKQPQHFLKNSIERG